MIECEIRGPLTWSDFCEIKQEIEKDLGRMRKTIELVIFLQGKKDLRLKINNFGLTLVLKKRINKNLLAKLEQEVHFPLSYLRNILTILDFFGYKKGFFSYCEKYEYLSPTISFSAKFNTKIGDYFEIEEKLIHKNKIALIQKKLVQMARKYGLLVWDEKTFEKIKSQSWQDVVPKKLIINNKPNPLIRDILDKLSASKNKKFLNGGRISIKQILNGRSNDYTYLEKEFYNLIGSPLVSWKKLSKNIVFKKPVSVVIPTFNSGKSLIKTLTSIKNQNLTTEERKLVELIVVDDGSNDNTKEIVSQFKSNFSLKYFYQTNMGRGQARNVGGFLASGDTLIFLDSDVILEKNFIREHAIRQELLKKIVLLSFKENLDPEDPRLTEEKFLEKLPMPDITKDFRFEKQVKKDWLRMHRHVRNFEVRKVNLLKETDNFKNFGNGKVIGVWDLPSMLVSLAVSLKTSEFRKIGGFNLQFKGWGMEDTFLGACLLAKDNYFIPCFSTGVYHLEHPPRSGSKLKMISEFNRNVIVYLDLINLPAKKIIKDFS